MQTCKSLADILQLHKDSDDTAIVSIDNELGKLCVSYRQLSEILVEVGEIFGFAKSKLIVGIFGKWTFDFYAIVLG
jgi:hypothetical protein